jgi:DNA-binding transcriptional regulator LsrR (DeoR family)
MGKLEDVTSMAVGVVAASPKVTDSILESELHESLLLEDVSIVIGVDNDEDSDVAALGDMGI